MRRFLLVAAIVGTASAAQAADMPDFLRGSFTAPVARTNWQGFYIGGQASYGAADMDFTNSGQDLLKKLLNNVDVEQQFNISELAAAEQDLDAEQRFRRLFRLQRQWTDVVVGVELNYIHGKFFNSSNTGSQGRTFFFPTDYQTTAFVTSSASMNVTDYGSLRVRGGYAMGCFLPYLFGGVALGQANINRCRKLRPELHVCRHANSAASRSSEYWIVHRQPDRHRERAFHLRLFRRPRHRHDAVCKPVRARRVGIPALHRAGRHHHQHRARRHRLQVLSSAILLTDRVEAAALSPQ